MNKIKETLHLKKNTLNIKYFLVLMLMAFIFSILVRMIWVDQFSGVDNFKWNNQLMINTNDGYFYAEGARDILAGTHQDNDLSPVSQPLSRLTAFLASILPISFETLILYMPTFFGSLLIVPIMLITRIFKQDMVGFVAALLGGIVWSYYNRTMTGYYDTDLLVVVLPTFFIWGVLYSLSHEDSDSFLIAPLFAIATMHWHGGLVHIVNGVFILTLIYTFFYEKHNLYYYKFLSILVIALTTLPVLVKVLFMIALVTSFHFLRDKLTKKIVISISLLSAFIYLVFGGADWIIGILNNAYITRIFADDVNLSLHYFGVVGTVREVGSIPFETFANRISGHTLTFWLSIVGYMLFIWRYKLFIVTFPMVILGFFALQGGLRFTVFSVPFMAIGISYFIFIMANIVENLFADNIKEYAKYGFIVLATIAVLYPNIMHIIAYKVPTVFNKEEVVVLDKLGQIATREDYVLSWWDYGYPIRYYADVKTLVDGGKHDGSSNFPVSFALLNNQTAAANMLRLDVEFTELNFSKPCGPSIECMLKHSNIKNPNALVSALNSKTLQLPTKTRDIFVYLPNRMLNILPTVDLFSNLDLLTGKQKKRPLFFVSKSFTEDTTSIKLGNGVQVMKQGGKIKIGNQLVNLNQFIVTEYDSKGVLHKNIQNIDPTSQVFVIFMKNYNQFLVLDRRLYNSLFIQLFVLENANKDLFEPVILSPLAKVYKLKI
ncbi:peptide transporter [Sulfurimonas sp. SAG-AH-194-I05]|nr:STT3 domain-containing protein [Sulfurimonas sp. SAG-AH-194-I05]MDF1875193.1 peptide transporter [Sulfurimonas sp. SAG-AH-194-I05]